MNHNYYDVVIIGAGAAGLFCAFNAGLRGKRVLLLDHANKVGKKILMSGGGRCNFTNLNTTHEDFSSENPHFCKSALHQYTAYDFLALVEKYNIDYVEKGPGQLFCKESSKDILNMLLEECSKNAVKIFKKCEIISIEKNDTFEVNTSHENYQAESLVIATGGLSIPTLGATGYGYELAEKFGHKIIPTRASLVPFTLEKDLKEKISQLAGVSLKVDISCKNKKMFSIEDDMLITHRGLSGPAVLKISEYWREGSEVKIDLLPEQNIVSYLESEKDIHPDQLLTNNLGQVFPKRLAAYICGVEYSTKKVRQLDKKDLQKLEEKVHHWTIIPAGTEGYRTAEVTSGGINTDDISSKTFESKLVKNLYFIGEVLDVTGQLGGYNFQWAWSSGWCAAQNL